MTAIPTASTYRNDGAQEEYKRLCDAVGNILRVVPKVIVVLINTCFVVFYIFFILCICGNMMIPSSLMLNLSRGEFGDSLGAFRYSVLG